MQGYSVKLDTYSGPMDLLLYLIRREEVDIYDIPISRILEQYLGYMALLKVLDPEAIGEFLVLAATLMEIKSRLLLPKPPPEEQEDDDFDPRADLVRQLLAYKTFRDAAHQLGSRAESHARRFGRPPVELPKDEQGQEVDIEDAQVWDLLAAFNQLVASVGQKGGFHEVTYDDTPITLHAADVLDRMVREGPVMEFKSIFEGRKLGEMVGLFLALLELIRQKRVRIDQEAQFGSIQVHLIDATPITTLSGEEDDGVSAADLVEEAPEFEDAREEEVEEEDEPFDNSQFMDELLEDEDDEYTRAIHAVEIGDVDLGRDMKSARAKKPDTQDDEATEAVVADDVDEAEVAADAGEAEASGVSDEVIAEDDVESVDEIVRESTDDTEDEESL